MASYGEPDWANPDNATASGGGSGPTAAPASTSSIRSSGSGGRSGGGRDSWVLALLSLADIGIAAMMATLGVLVLLEFRGLSPDDYSRAFLSAYMIVFALLLFSYELMWWMAIPFVNKTLRKNFGFLYGLTGKGLYLIFVAFLCLGLGDDNSVRELTWATGIAYLTFGVLHILIQLMCPDIADKYRAPTAGLTTMGDNAV